MGESAPDSRPADARRGRDTRNEAVDLGDRRDGQQGDGPLGAERFLEDVLQRIADFTEHQEDLKAKVVGALAYPVFLAGAGFIVLNILILFFVPRFEPIFKKLEDKDALPTISMLLMGTSHFLMGWGGVGALAAIVVGGMIYWRWSGTPTGRLRVDGWRLRLPGATAAYLLRQPLQKRLAWRDFLAIKQALEG